MSYSRIFISPHPDDIAYSCFGTIFNTKCSPDTDLLITVFSVSEFCKPDTETVEIFSRRRINEDEVFCNWVGCKYVKLDFPDSDLRKKNSNTTEIKAKIREVLKDVLYRHNQANIYIPLACTNHEDHKMVRDIVISIFKYENFPIERLFLYEELPYANSLSKYDLKKHIKEIDIDKSKYKFVPIHVDVETCWIDKILAFHIYATQKLQDTLESITRHADMTGKNRKTERLWKITGKGLTLSRNFAWVSWEASRSIGGIGVFMNSIFNTNKYKESAYRTILIGPMHMPLNVDPQPERIDTIAVRLKSKILYAYGEGTCGLEKEICRKLKQIENIYGVGIAYLRDYPQIDNPQTIERILVDFSYTITKNNVYSANLKYFLRELEEKLGLDITYNTVEKELLSESQKYFYTDELKRWLINSKDNTSQYNHIDNDSLYGLLIAKPAIAALDTILKSNEICILNSMDYFSLPTVYAAVMERMNGETSGTSTTGNIKMNNFRKYKIRTHYLASEVKPVRSIAEGYIKLYDLPSPWKPEKESEILIRCLIKNAVKGNKRFTLTDYPDLKHIEIHPPIKLLQKVHLLDYVSAISEQVRDELMAININISAIGIAPHGNRYIELGDVNEKSHYKGKIIDLLNNQACDDVHWGKFYHGLDTENLILSIHISRPEYCKKLERDIDMLNVLKIQSTINQKKIIHLFIGAFNRNYCKEYSEYLKKKVKMINEESGNVYCKIIDDPAWPYYKNEKGELNFTRDDLFRAADLNFGLSSYDSYGLSPLESLSCGAISVISAASGSSSHINKLGEYKKNVIIVDYHSDFCDSKHYYPDKSPNEIEAVLRKLEKEPLTYKATKMYEAIEYHNHLSAVNIAKIIPQDKTALRELVESGKKLSKKISWENIAELYFFAEGKPFQQLFENKEE